MYFRSWLRFSWDARKAAANLRKHGVSFEEASSVFNDDSALLMSDPDHSVQEQRCILLGLSAKLRTLVVSHCYRASEDELRIISARKASRAERLQYVARWRQ